MKRAQKKELVDFQVVQLRDFATDPHRSVDAPPFGGGAGMVLRADVLLRAWKALEGDQPQTRTLLMSPQGKVFDQQQAKVWTSSDVKHWIFICGHYEGVDERFVELCVDQEVSVGDFILTGGELPALLVAETLVRLLPGLLGNPDSVAYETFENGTLKHPVYTRPQELEGKRVPEVLLSGNHQAIRSWREQERLNRTLKKRPDLIS